MFTAPVAPTLPYDPFKHVKYTTGMVLGVDDFTQDFAYLTGRDQLLAREVIGYGTVTGLAVSTANGDKGFEVTVTPGVAITPRGIFVRVPSVRCARINDWLDANRTEVTKNTSAPPSNAIRLYVVLCYSECPVDLRAIPGEPCRTEDESMRESRVQDDYLLKLTWEAPDQRQFDAQGDFVAWLRAIPLDDNPLSDTPANLDAFVAAMRNAAPQLQSPPASPPMSPPDFMVGSPPAGLVIPRIALCKYLDTAFRLWVTEIRPLYLGKNQAVAGGMPDEECVLLAQLDITLTNGRVALESDIAITEEQRPYVVSLQMLQEWVLCGLTNYLEAGGSAAVLDGDVTVPAADGKNEIRSLQGTRVASGLLTAADDDKVLTVTNGQWIARKLDATPAATLAGDVTVPAADGINEIQSLQGTPVASGLLSAADDNKVLTIANGQWVAAALTGDVTVPAGGTINEIQSLQEITLNAKGLVSPTDDGKVLTFINDQWTAAPASSSIIVAAGRFNGDGSSVFSMSNLVAHPIVIKNSVNGLFTQLYFLTFEGYAVENRYIVKGTIVNTLFGDPRVIEVINLGQLEGDNLIKLGEIITEYNASGVSDIAISMANLCVRISYPVPGDGQEPAPNGFMIEISDVTSQP